MSYNSNIVAVLCNGPSKKLYDESKEYAYRIGCNVPWTRVDATVVIDIDMVKVWKQTPTLITCPVYFTSKAWMYADEIKFRTYINDNNLFLGLVNKLENDSSGNIACKKLIELGYKNIDIYGADAYSTLTHGYNNDSYTRKFIPEVRTNNSYRWKTMWDDMIKNNPSVSFNFIKEQK